MGDELENKIEERLQAIAGRTHRTKAYHIREAILAYLEDLEGIYFAEVSLSDLSLGKSKPITINEMEKG